MQACQNVDLSKQVFNLDFLQSTEVNDVKGVCQENQAQHVGQPLRHCEKLKANPPLCYCMHVGSAASRQQSSHVQQHMTKQPPGATQLLALGLADREQQDSG